MKKYDCIIVDAVNFAYKTFKAKNDVLIQISNKEVYKNSICRFINAIEDLRKKYLNFDNGKVYLLFDNYFSRADLQSAFTYADRKSLDEAYKASRKKESKEFYQSLNFIRYFYLIGPSDYATLRLDNLEADDLVKPLLSDECKGKSCLLVSSDLDWTRYLSKTVDWLPELGKEPQTVEDLSYELGFPVNEMTITLYKAIFGDPSDNIKDLCALDDNTKQEFIQIITDVTYPEEAILLARNTTKSCSNSVLKAIKDNEKKFIVNIQLVSSIPCAVSFINSQLTFGRHHETLYSVVKEAIGLSESKTKFSFGGIKRPRVQ